MFIREVIKKNKGYAKPFVYHQLVESFRTEKGPRQRRLLELGRLTIPKAQWKSLANRIEELLSGQKLLLEPNPLIEPLAQHYATLLMHKQLNSEADLEDRERPEYEEVDLNSLRNRQARSIGGEHVALSMIEHIGFAQLFSQFGFSEIELKLAELLIVARLIHPGSERETVRWARHNSAICELLGLELWAVYHSQLYRISDRLLAHKAALEAGLTRRERSLFSLQEQIVLYDLTNTYFESSRVDSLKRRARSKDRRHDMPLVTLGLVLDEDGFPKQSHIFEGNISEPGTFVKVLEQIGGEHRKVIIFDAGLATEHNLQLIRDNGHDYIVVSRKRLDLAINEEELIEIGHDQRHRVEAYLQRGADEVILYCRSHLKKRKEASIRSFHQERFEADLKYASESLHKKRGTKRYAKVLERIGRLKQKHSRVAYFYDIQLKQQDGVVTEISWKIRDEKRMDERFAGSYYLRTNRRDLNEKQIWNLYISLTDIEESFRSMKSELGLRPNYHQEEIRIKGHIFITVLAHHVVNAVQKYLHQQRVYMRWSTIREWLSSQQRVTTEMRNRQGKWIRIRQTTEPESFNYMLAKALNIRAKPLGIKRQKM